jgi:hypothetical protein
MTDEEQKPDKIVPFPQRRAAGKKADCLAEARRLMMLADNATDLQLRAWLLHDAGEWLARAKRCP